MSIGKPSGAGRTGRRHGFALIIVVSLLALLVLALVSLATLTRIETQVGVNSRIQAQARQNARFALEQALGELQRHAGPDARITATADLVGVTNENRHWTGIWNPDGTGRTWLVSGNENGRLDVVPAAGPVGVAAYVNASTPGTTALSRDVTIGGSEARLLVGYNSGGNDPNGDNTPDTLNYVFAPLVALDGPSVADGETDVVGRYAWWVGDEGVKASMALRDRLAEVNYGTYSTDELRARLRQQVPFAHQSFVASEGSASGKHGFDPAVGANPLSIAHVVTRNQLMMLSAASDVGLPTNVRQRYHDWTTTSTGVLANTRTDSFRGLRKDLSLVPQLLGTAAGAWVDFTSYMENPLAPLSPVATPAITSEEDVRRRYRITPPIGGGAAGDPVFSISPIVSDFLIQFSVRVDAASGGLLLRARALVGLWNPYSSALVPATLRLDVSGLPTVTIAQPATGSSVLVPLQSILGDPVALTLSFSGTAADQVSWLPGRVHYWRTQETASPWNPTPPFEVSFYRKNFTSAANQDVTATGGAVVGWEFVAAPVGTFVPPSSTEPISISCASSAQITARLRLGSAADDPLLCEYAAPEMDAFPAILQYSQSAPGGPPASGDWTFGFGFRLNQPVRPPGSSTIAASPWLEVDRGDPRGPVVTTNGGLTLTVFAPWVANAASPTSYGGNLFNATNADAGSSSRPGLLLNRTVDGTASRSPNNDLPLFELPRSPVLSLASMQHLNVLGLRPYAIGNSWGASALPVATGGYEGGSVATWFDRFYFSGVPSAGGRPDLSSGEPLPYYHIRPFAPVALDDVRGLSPYTSQALMIDGAFNVNSTRPEAWEALLKGLRPAATFGWERASLTGSGTVGSSNPIVVDNLQDLSQGGTGTQSARTSAFLRFSHSAQEVFQTTGAVSGFNRHRFRQGFLGGSGGTGATAGRNLRIADFRSLAQRIAGQVRSAGPFLTLEQFVSIVPSTPGSALENAIREANLNADVPDMCAYWLSQADILTAVGPMLSTRSDTFTIRAYGETVNPALPRLHQDYVQARAWCEATVQRIPTPVDPNDDIVQPAGPFGRRFVITSFRWLSPDDI